MKTRLLARTITYDPKTNKILLVRNKGTKFWYAPGGGWETDRETIIECAAREVYEETGLKVSIKRLLYVQEFHESADTTFFESFWLGELTHTQQLDEAHVDLDPNGSVEEARWLSQDELAEMKVFPMRLKDTFWDELSALDSISDPFIGVS